MLAVCSSSSVLRNTHCRLVQEVGPPCALSRSDGTVLCTATAAMATGGDGAGDTTPHTSTMAEVVAQLASQNDVMVQMRRMLEEFRGRLEVGDADRLRLQQQVGQGERLRQQDVGRMQELRDQAAAATASAAAGRGYKARLVMQGYDQSFAHQLDVPVAGMKRAFRAVQREQIRERGNVFEMEYLEEVKEHLKGEIQLGIDKMLELQDLVLAVDARGDDNSPVTSSQGEDLVVDTATSGSDAERHGKGRCDRGKSKGFGCEICCARVFIMARKHT
jgi:hypothetical protein